MKASPSLAVCAMLAASFIAFHVHAAEPAPVYYPPAGSWERKPPAELGMDPAALASAVAFAQTRESTRAMDFSDQETIFGSMLGSVPDIRAKTNGLVIYKGYVVAEFGDTTWVDPTYSVAKSMLSTVAAIADFRLALILIDDHGFDFDAVEDWIAGTTARAVLTRDGMEP